MAALIYHEHYLSIHFLGSSIYSEVLQSGQHYQSDAGFLKGTSDYRIEIIMVLRLGQSILHGFLKLTLVILRNIHLDRLIHRDLDHCIGIHRIGTAKLI